MRTAERSVRDRLTAGHRQRLRVSSAALGTAVARQARLDDVTQAAQEEALQAAKADGQIAKKQQELQLKLHEQAKVLYGEEYAPNPNPNPNPNPSPNPSPNPDPNPNPNPNQARSTHGTRWQYASRRTRRP